MNRIKFIAAAAFLLLVAAACNSTYPVLGQPQTTNYDLRGTVDQVDLSSRSVYLTNVNGNTAMLSSSGNGSGGAARVFFSDSTPVYYQGKTYRADQLDRGDQISVHVSDNGNRLEADSITVLYNSMGSSYPSSTYPGGTYSSPIRGTVRYVDTGRRTIDIDHST